jgi:hypothetical protein
MDKDADEIVETLNLILSKMASREDVDNVRTELRAEIHEGFNGLRAEMRERLTDVRSDIKDIRERLDALDSAVGNISGYAKEIDHLIERVSAIETHLGWRENIAA